MTTTQTLLADAAYSNGRAIIFVVDSTAILPNGKRAKASDYSDSDDWSEVEVERVAARATTEQVEAVTVLANPAKPTGYREPPTARIARVVRHRSGRVGVAISLPRLLTLVKALDDLNLRMGARAPKLVQR